MRANNVLGIIYASTYDQSLPELTNMRTMGSVPFGGRYRLIDFPLSNMVNSGISKVGVITKSNYRSLMDHLGTGKPWDLSRKREGMFILPPFNSAASDVYKRQTPQRIPADCLQTELTRLSAVRRSYRARLTNMSCSATATRFAILISTCSLTRTSRAVRISPRHTATAPFPR